MLHRRNLVGLGIPVHVTSAQDAPDALSQLLSTARLGVR